MQYYQAFVKVKNSSEEEKPVTWGNLTYFSDNQAQLLGMIQIMTQHFHLNQYTIAPFSL